MGVQPGEWSALGASGAEAKSQVARGGRVRAAFVMPRSPPRSPSAPDGPRPPCSPSGQAVAIMSIAPWNGSWNEPQSPRAAQEVGGDSDDRPPKRWRRFESCPGARRSEGGYGSSSAVSEGVYSSEVQQSDTWPSLRGSQGGGPRRARGD